MLYKKNTCPSDTENEAIQNQQNMKHSNKETTIKQKALYYKEVREVVRKQTKQYINKNNITKIHC